jgi:hypothetical protein
VASGWQQKGMKGTKQSEIAARGFDRIIYFSARLLGARDYLHFGELIGVGGRSAVGVRRCNSGVWPKWSLDQVGDLFRFSLLFAQ